MFVGRIGLLPNEDGKLQISEWEQFNTDMQIWMRLAQIIRAYGDFLIFAEIIWTAFAHLESVRHIRTWDDVTVIRPWKTCKTLRIFSGKLMIPLEKLMISLEKLYGYFCETKNINFQFGHQSNMTGESI